MTRPLIIDTFPANDEFELLECRLTEMYDAIDFAVAVEADVDHQGHQKPYHLTEQLDRFAPWKDKLIVVRATGLPTVAQDADPWARELAQRGHVAKGLEQIGVSADDIILHGDIDEICRPLHVRNCRPRPGWFISFEQRLHCFCVDWLHPEMWYGTVAGRAADVKALEDNLNGFARMRNKRNYWDKPGERVQAEPMRDAGWHLSWLGGKEAAFKKLHSFCHPEVADRINEGLSTDLFLREGWHVDGRKMRAVDVDDSWPKWIVDGKAPLSWFRPR